MSRTLADKYDLLSVIKKAAVEAVENMYPCNFVFATARDIVRDESNEVIELTAYISDKLQPDLDFLVFGSAVLKNSIEENDKLILLRQAGGQLFYVMDIIERGESNAAE